MHTQYENGRKLRCATSVDGIEWTTPVRLAEIEQGHYQVTAQRDGKLVTAFNYHPQVGGLEARTNLYFMQSVDNGVTWTTAAGKVLDVPLTTIENPALIHDYRAQGLLVYMKDITFDAAGNPVILFITSHGNLPGPQNDPRTWTTARWTGTEWVFHPVTTSDSNYDMGPLYIEDNQWRIIGPTQPGAFAYNPGGEIARWTSTDQGITWQMTRELTAHSTMNHTFVRRPVNAHPDFYALWADGNPLEPAASRLYFTNRTCDAVRKLPTQMDDDFATPQIVEPVR